ncbi:sensor histidine kinase [Enterococcus mundtii]|uniref:sensor histidine kinase n=1 Tax=Enterococcus mundtii TaxID=53346 RepID=UPI003970E52F
MTDSIFNKQRTKLFAANVTAFALIFLLLGGIILQLLNQSAYRETDLMLKNVSLNAHMVQLEIERYQQGDPFFNAQIPPRQTESLPEGDRFNTQVILWSAAGEVLNKETIGGRFNQIEGIKLDTSKLDTIQDIELAQADQGTPLYFRSITKKATNQGAVAYVQVLENTNQINSSLRTFQTILILCMIVFWLGSIGVSYYLSKLNMRPILASWRRQREFVENASHELRTPLTIIQNSLEHLFTKPNHTIIEESESIAQALSETRRLTGLTSDLLTLARSDSSQDTLAKQELQTKGFIAELIKPFQEMATIDQKEFIVENQADMSVLVDPKKIHQVLVILLDNALKYTSEHDEIIVTSASTNKDWVIHVKNTGPAISDEDKKRIFERFYREDQARSKETGGYGLGLAIAKQLIEQHKGQLTVSDHLPVGVDFKIQLPIK